MRILCLLLLFITTPLMAVEEITKEEVFAVAKETKQKIESIDGYQFTLQKKELVEGKHYSHNMEVKVRTKPLAIYLKYLAPKKYEGREALYPSDIGDITVRMGGHRMPNQVWSVDPNGQMAMEANRYPITYINPKVVATELMTRIENELKFPETKLAVFRQAKVGGQPVTAYVMVHTEQKEGMECRRAEIGICLQLGVPIFFRVEDWHGRTIEHYVFQKMILNPQFTDDEFDEENPEYGFKTKDGQGGADSP